LSQAPNRPLPVGSLARLLSVWPDRLSQLRRFNHPSTDRNRSGATTIRRHHARTPRALNFLVHGVPAA